MAIRSWLFVPGDSDRKLAKAADSGADAIIVDLEDSVAPAAKPLARRLAHDWLAARAGMAGPAPWVRINPLDTPWWRDDLIAVMPAAPAGIMLPKAAGPSDLQRLAGELYEFEQACGVPPGQTRIMPVASETAGAALAIPSYAETSLPRLSGLTWGAEDLSAAIGAGRKRFPDGTWTDTFRLVRAQILLAAHACGIDAVDTLHADFRDEDGLRRAAEAARADGFTGMLAIHPAQVRIINAAFVPSEEELAESRAIVAAFAAAPGAGALQIDGRMIDRPHLVLARRILGLD